MDRTPVTTKGGIESRQLIMQAFLGLLAAVAAGVLFNLFWHHQGLPGIPPSWTWRGGSPAPGLDRHAAVLLSLTAWLPSIILVVMAWLWPMENNQDTLPIEKALSLDAATYLLLSALAILPLVWRELGNGFLALTLGLTGLLAVKVGLVLWALWHGFLRFQNSQGAKGRQTLLVVLASLLVCLTLTLSWAWVASPPAAGQVGTSAGTSLGIDVSGNESVQTLARALHSRLLAPLERWAGTPGLVAISAACLSLWGLLLWNWLDRAGIDKRVAPLTVGVLLFSAPVLALGFGDGAEPLVMLLVVATLSLWSHFGGKAWQGGLAVSIPLISLALLFYWDQPESFGKLASVKGPDRLVDIPWLFITAPTLLLALAGIPTALSKHRKEIITASIPGAAAILWLILDQEAMIAGRGPMLMTLWAPLAGLGMAVCLERLDRPWWRIMPTGLIALGLLMSWFAVMLPALWPSWSLAGSRFAVLVERHFGQGVVDTLASGSFWVLAPSVTLSVLMAVQCWRAPGPVEPSEGWSPEEGLGLALVLVGVLVLCATLATI